MTRAKLAIAAAVAVMLTGCASSPTEQAIDAQKEIMDAKNEQLQQELDEVPDWALKPPVADGVGMFGVGIGSSDSLNMAIKKARLEAEFALAKTYSQELSGSERSYSTDSGGFSTERYEGLIDKLVERVPVVGFSTEESEVRVMGGKYHAYVLLKLPYDEFNKVLRERRDRESAASMKAAFDDLERRLAERQKVRMEEFKAVTGAAQASQSSSTIPAPIPEGSSSDLSARVE